MGKIRNAVEKIHAALLDPVAVKKKFGRRAAGEHSKGPTILYIPIGGPVSRGTRTSGTTVPGSAGKIQPSVNASLTQPNVDVRTTECATRETRILAICEAGQGKSEADAIDEAEALLEELIAAAWKTFPNDVSFDAERWLIQEEERASLGVAGEAVSVQLVFRWPVLLEERPVVKLLGFTQTCKLGETLEDD